MLDLQLLSQYGSPKNWADPSPRYTSDVARSSDQEQTVARSKHQQLHQMLLSKKQYENNQQQQKEEKLGWGVKLGIFYPQAVISDSQLYGSNVVLGRDPFT